MSLKIRFVMKKFFGKSILVTGGNGAIGSTLVKKLLTFNANIVVLDDFSQSNKGNLPKSKNIKIIYGDITDDIILKKLFLRKFDYIFHLAARFANELSVKNPSEDLRVNVLGTLKILLYAAKQHPTRFLYASSSSIFGAQKNITFNENSIPNPSTPYAASKLSGEIYCKSIHELYGLNYSIIRISNSYGPVDLPGKFRNVIPNFFNAAMSGKDLIITGNGTETRDFTFVDDIVNGILLTASSKKGKNQTFNLGTGKETTIKKIADNIIKLTGNKSKIRYVPRRNFDHVKNRKMNIKKAKQILKYKPEIKIELGLKKTYEWFLQNYD
jgi:UDP-glucose 4-epimerase